MELVLIPFKVGQGRTDTDLSVDLLRLKIHHRGTIVNAPKSGVYSCIKEDGFRQRGFSLPPVTKGSYVSNMARLNALHLHSFPSSIP
jgi:hypothetical protein